MPAKTNDADLKRRLEKLRKRYNHRRYASPDPVEIVHQFTEPADQEVAALLASSLAFGNVKTILASAREVLRRMNGQPHLYLSTCTREALKRDMRGFRHRYAGDSTIEGLLWAARCALDQHGTLGNSFTTHINPADKTTLPALATWCTQLRAYAGQEINYLIPAPERGSACKRLHMLLRWMVRSDAIDLGIWCNIDTRMLIVPIDTHMHRVARSLGFTKRNQADARCAIEVTEAFRAIAPKDPVRYDFSLTRLGIRGDTDEDFPL